MHGVFALGLQLWFRPRPPKPSAPYLDNLGELVRFKDAAIDERLRPKRPPLPSTLPPVDNAEVDELMKKRGVIENHFPV